MYSFSVFTFLTLTPLALGQHAGGSTLQLKRTACTTPEGSGTCVSTSSCTGFSVAGYCPGDSSIQCCISKSCTVSGNTGTCLNTSKGCSGGSFQGEVCPGDESISCCIKGGSSGGGSNPPPPSSSDPHPINSASLQLIESEEGFRSDFYTIDGDKTVGYGHDCTQKGDCSSIHTPLSQSDGEALLKKDLVSYESCVCKMPNASKLNANQYGALTSFTYNAGCGGLQDNFSGYFSKSDFSGACDALPNTETNGGELSSRRKREQDLCNTATSDKSGC